MTKIKHLQNSGDLGPRELDDKPPDITPVGGIPNIKVRGHIYFGIFHSIKTYVHDMNIKLFYKFYRFHRL